MIVCVRTVRIPPEARDRFVAWIEENRELRERHGILFELVLERSPRQNPAKTIKPAEPAPQAEDLALVLTAWASHEAFDAWIDTPDRDRLTASDVHGRRRGRLLAARSGDRERVRRRGGPARSSALARGFGRGHRSWQWALRRAGNTRP